MYLCDWLHKGMNMSVYGVCQPLKATELKQTNKATIK